MFKITQFYEFFMASRYFRTRKYYRTFSLMNYLTIFGVALGVFSMILVIAVMNGLETDVMNKLLKVQSHVFLNKTNKELITDWETIARKIRVIPHVQAIAPCLLGSGLVVNSEQAESVVVKGIFPGLEMNVINIESIMKDGKYVDMTRSFNGLNHIDQPPGKIIMGYSLSNKLGLIPKETTKLIFTTGKNSQLEKFVFMGSFETGFQDYDDELVMVPVEDLRRLFHLPEGVSGVQVRIDNYILSREVSHTIKKVLGPGFQVRDWKSMHSNLFAAMSLEKKAMSVILFIFILVAASGIAGSVAILITQKRKEIGILKSVGAQDYSILSIFLIEGVIIGVTGILVGGIPGVLFCYLANRYELININVELFRSFSVPFILQGSDICYIAVGAILICMVASFLPAWKASKLNPISAIRE